MKRTTGYFDWTVSFRNGWKETGQCGRKRLERRGCQCARVRCCFMGHDHTRWNERVANASGDSVLVIDPANTAKVVSEVTVTLKKQNGNIVSKQVDGKLVNMDDYAVDKDFMHTFQKQYEATQAFVSRKIGRMERTISSKDAFFGPSAFIDLIHQLQLDITGADISFCAPLSAYAEIKEGDIRMSDMFNLYKFENMLYTMVLTGKEVKDFLEMSYDLWVNQMTSPDDHLLLLNEKTTVSVVSVIPASILILRRGLSIRWM